MGEDKVLVEKPEVGIYGKVALERFVTGVRGNVLNSSDSG
jgi:hypothetical protein